MEGRANEDGSKYAGASSNVFPFLRVSRNGTLLAGGFRSTKKVSNVKQIFLKANPSQF
jgi:hypothetical protein